MKLPDVPSETETSILLDGPFPTAFPEPDRLILHFLYGCGLRVSEAANLKVSDFRPEQDAFLINGKGGMYGKAAKQRLVPINPTLQTALDQYFAARAKLLGDRKTDVPFETDAPALGEFTRLTCAAFTGCYCASASCAASSRCTRIYYVTPAQPTCWRTAVRWT